MGIDSISVCFVREFMKILVSIIFVSFPCNYFIDCEVVWFVVCWRISVV